MFGKIALKTLRLSDKSKIDEYCFTNFALLHLDSNIALSKKRLLTYYEFINADSRNVLETFIKH